MNILEQIKLWLLKARGYDNRGNDGFIPYEPKEEDWKSFGASEVLNESGDWTPYLPSDERQRRYGLETMSCVSFSACNVVEILFNFKLKKGLIDKSNVKWLEENGYLDEDNKVNFSDRFIAVLSNTSRNGNIGKRVFTAIKDYGMIPESMLPFSANLDTWAEYHNKSDISQTMYNQGYEFKKRFPMNYFIEYDFEEGLKESPLQAYVYGNYTIHNGIIQYSGKMSTHAICIPKVDTIYDTYEEFLKKVVPNYPYYAGQDNRGRRYSYGYKVKYYENIIKKKMIKTIKQKNRPEIYAIDEENGILNSFGGWGSYVKFLQAGWCEDYLEVDNIYKYLLQKTKKRFVYGERVGVIK